MKATNTIAMAGTPDYAWGAWLCIASMRKCGMMEPVVISARGWSDEWKTCLRGLGDVSFHELPQEERSVCCSKAYAMLQCTETDYMCWVDCDAVFSGNCSELLLPPDEDSVRIRPRTPNDNNAVMGPFYEPGEEHDGIPRQILRQWQEDVNDLKEPRCRYAATSGVVCLHRKYRPFVELWQTQMNRFLQHTKEVVDSRNRAYFLTDESVLNSLLFFSSLAPRMVDRYGLDDNPAARYAHYSLSPKPWCMWNPVQLNKYDLTMEVIRWALAQGVVPPEPLPFLLREKNRRWAFRLAPLAPHYARMKRFLRRF